MIGPTKTKPGAARRRASENVGSGQGSNGGKSSPGDAAALLLALMGVDIARAQLDRYALETDAPAWGAIDAADFLDFARDRLSEALAGGAP